MPDRLTMLRPTLVLLTISAALALAGCGPAPRSAPPVAVEPAPGPVATFTPPPPIEQPVYETYLDAPQSPGDWSYFSGVEGGGTASFGTGGFPPLFVIECRRQALRPPVLTLYRGGEASGAVPMRIQTETQERLMTVTPDLSRAGTLSVVVNTTDPLLDAIAFSRGRFAIEVTGLRTLYLPAWPEITRVIEDCR